jgi:hypothetical protein
MPALAAQSTQSSSVIDSSSEVTSASREEKKKGKKKQAQRPPEFPVMSRKFGRLADGKLHLKYLLFSVDPNPGLIEKAHFIQTCVERSRSAPQRSGRWFCR